ncbi:MAG: hypothetical protein P4L77_02960 [Sulfuriferula sp.]|nr:hypothetical protein [Sulfuriferula sp.]
MFMLRTIIMLGCTLSFILPAVAQDKLRIAATPNPNIFPLLVAMADDPSLPVEIVPIADSKGMDAVFKQGQADALVAMTYAIAEKVTSGKIPDLRLVYVGLWKGFSEVTYKNDKITNFSELRGKGLIVAGPTGGGKDGGPDFIFQAALKRSGMTTADVHVCYLPVMEAVKLLKDHTPLNTNPHCDPSFSMPASGISLVEPAATGLIMQGMMSTSSVSGMERGISLQSLFTGYTAWPSDQLPHGGLSILGSVLDNPEQAQLVSEVLAAYKKAAEEIGTARGFHAMHIAKVISAGIEQHFHAYKLDLPAMVVMAAMVRGNLEFRSDAPVTIQDDLNRFLTEVIGTSPPKNFYALQ